MEKMVRKEMLDHKDQMGRKVRKERVERSKTIERMMTINPLYPFHPLRPHHNRIPKKGSTLSIPPRVRSFIRRVLSASVACASDVDGHLSRTAVARGLKRRGGRRGGTTA